MKIIVFGATGRVGSSVVEQSFKAGDDVTVFVRDRNKVKSIADKVSIVEGDALNELRVLAALAPGFDAVIFAIGASALKPSTLVTDSMRTVVSAMKKGKVSRLLGVSGTAEMPNQTAFGKVTNALLRLTPVGHAIRDHDGAFDEIKHSGLQWMLAGCPYIKDGPRRGRYQTSLVFPGGFKIIHPPDVADLLVRELVEKRFTGSVAGIWY